MDPLTIGALAGGVLGLDKTARQRKQNERNLPTYLEAIRMTPYDRALSNEFRGQYAPQAVDGPGNVAQMATVGAGVGQGVGNFQQQQELTPYYKALLTRQSSPVMQDPSAGYQSVDDNEYFNGSPDFGTSLQRQKPKYNLGPLGVR